MVRAAQVREAAKAIRLEQKFEDDILATAVRKLAAHRGDTVKQAQDMRELRELVRRDKRAVEVLSNVLGSSSGVSLQNHCCMELDWVKCIRHVKDAVLPHTSLSLDIPVMYVAVK